MKTIQEYYEKDGFVTPKTVHTCLFSTKNLIFMFAGMIIFMIIMGIISLISRLSFDEIVPLLFGTFSGMSFMLVLMMRLFKNSIWGKNK